MNDDKFFSLLLFGTFFVLSTLCITSYTHDMTLDNTVYILGSEKNIIDTLNFCTEKNETVFNGQNLAWEVQTRTKCKDLINREHGRTDGVSFTTEYMSKTIPCIPRCKHLGFLYCKYVCLSGD